MKRNAGHRQRQTRVHRALLFSACLLLLISSLCSSSQDQFIYPTARAERSDSKTVSTLTAAGRLAVFDDAWQTIHDRYYDPHFRGLDWEAQRTIFRPLAAEAANGEELYRVLRHLIAGLNDVHTRVFAPEEKFDWWKPRFVSIGLTVREIERLPTVVQVEKGSAPERAGIRAGDVIERVSGSLALSLLEERFSRQPQLASRPSSRLRAFTALLEGAPQTYVEVTWRRKNGELRHASFRRELRERQPGVRIRREGRYAVVEIEAFTSTIALDFARAMKHDLRGARGIVLDLRANGGGEAEAMAEVASTFLEAGVTLGTFTDRWGFSFNITTRPKSLFASDMITKTSLPLVVLTGERTSSAAEIFVSALRTAKRATILGAETCGCVLAIRNQHGLPDGGVLDVSELDYQTSQGSRLEENGIKPDETIALRRQDVYARRDRAMDRALEKLALLSKH